MYLTVLYSIIFGSLFLVLYQDLKYRQIHIVLPILVFFGGILLFVSEKIAFVALLQNIAFLSITLLLVYLYIILKNKKIINPFKSLIGIGDILFFIAVLPYFCLKNYILYFVSGMLFSIISFGILKVFYRDVETVPLAGFLALFFILLKLISFSSSKFHFFNPVF